MGIPSRIRSTGAPCWINSAAASKFPAMTATSSGVSPSGVSWVSSAPSSIRLLAQSKSPHATASWRGKSPKLMVVLKSSCPSFSCATMSSMFAWKRVEKLRARLFSILARSWFPLVSPNPAFVQAAFRSRLLALMSRRLWALGSFASSHSILFSWLVALLKRLRRPEVSSNTGTQLLVQLPFIPHADTQACSVCACAKCTSSV